MSRFGLRIVINVGTLKRKLGSIELLERSQLVSCSRLEKDTNSRPEVVVVHRVWVYFDLLNDTSVASPCTHCARIGLVGHYP